MTLKGSIKSKKSGSGIRTEVKVYSFSSEIMYSFDSGFDITAFSDNFTVNTNKEQVYGRIDPIVNYSNTARQISWSISFNEDIDNNVATIDGANLDALRALAGDLYPRYDTVGDSYNINVLKSPPLVAIYVAGYVLGTFSFTPKQVFSSTAKNNKTAEDSKKKEDFFLVGYLDSFGITYDVKTGLVANTNANIQREYSANFSFTPIHESPGGKNSKGEDLKKGWPWPT